MKDTALVAVEHPVPAISEALTLGKIFHESGFFADVRGMSQAVTKILAGRELGIQPMAAMTGIYVVKGRVTLSANLLASLVKRSGRYDYRVVKLTDQECELEFSEAPLSGQRRVLGISSFSMADAKKAGLGGDNWSKYPKNMLFARAMSNGVRFYTPDITGGPIYTPDEMGARVDGDTGDVIDIAPVEVREIPVSLPAAAQIVETPQGKVNSATGEIMEKVSREVADAEEHAKAELQLRNLLTEAESLGLTTAKLGIEKDTPLGNLLHAAEERSKRYSEIPLRRVPASQMVAAALELLEWLEIERGREPEPVGSEHAELDQELDAALARRE